MEESPGKEEGESKATRKEISTRGVPSSEVFYLPRHDSPEIRQFQDSSEAMTRNIWAIEELLNFVFPKRFRKKYYEVAVAFMKELMEKGKLQGKEIADFVDRNGFSKATFYNRVLVRLKRIGMVKVERMTITMDGTKYRPMKITISKTFGNYLMKIADSWLVLVDDHRDRHRQSRLLQE